ncbi:LacI family DNA-binding transcriptional regulator [Paenibacillus polysaccharolyticus]|uniref:LacI family DNA-binding transcriptional regulator n=1 Tax=Paenibacillus polysaccharolyticus TaxID=582692 RepID=UPI00280BAE71|nr:LacI family DNA-binding transcriptional regulator [Paenibacillus polysaccharolyticus]MDP9700726.1 LacI family transcriptional regulator [Paenibacillus intestini]
MSRKVSIQTLADQLGLSKYAVSRALSGKTGVSESTRARVLELARALGYRQNIPGSASHTANTNKAHAIEPPFVLICMNQLNRGEPHYWQRVLSGIISGCNEQGWHHVIVSPSLDLPGKEISPEKAIAPHLDWTRCAGIIVMGAFPHTVLQTLVQTGHPMILVDHQEPLLNCDTISHDNLEAGITAARYLLSKQCRRIGLITDDGRAASFAQRKIGIELALNHFYTEAREEVDFQAWNVAYENGEWVNKLADTIERLPAEERPDAWIGANDDIALQWMHKLQHMGLSTPKDCLVIGIDNVYTAATSSPPLTTVHLCKEELGQRAVEALKRRIERLGTPKETVMLSTTLIPRDSA